MGWAMRRLGIVSAVILLVLATVIGPAAAGSTTEAGEESTYLDTATQWFMGQRAAPNESVNPDAYAALKAQAAALPVTGGSWTERSHGDYFTDSPTYAPIDMVPSWSPTGVQWAPRSVDFQIPPSAAPAKTSPLPATARAVIRPLT